MITEFCESLVSPELGDHETSAATTTMMIMTTSAAVTMRRVRVGLMPPQCSRQPQAQSSPQVRPGNTPRFRGVRK